MTPVPRLLRISALAGFMVAALTLGATAHPLGNFTINHLTKVRVSSASIDVRYVLDMAEIPTYQLMREHAPDGRMTAAQLAAWADAQAAELAPQLHLTLDGRRLPLATVATSARTRPGAGGLPILYLRADYRAPFTAASGTRDLRFEDDSYPGRLGWKDAIVAPPQSEPTQELSAYPNALLGSPRNVTAAAATLGPAGAIAVVPAPNAPAADGGAPSAVRSNQLSDMLARGTGDPAVVALTLLVAVLLGALHALEPGHGKTLLAVSLVGARATMKQAAILAAALTVAHTAGVLALGLAINAFKSYFVPETIYPWITLLSGVAIAIVGARAVERQIRLRRPLAHVHAHGHDGLHDHDHVHVHHAHGHAHAHPHAHGHAHVHDDEAHARAHAIPGTAPLKFGSTVLAAMSGGIAPCPAALVVLLAAIALNQVLYGTFVIVAFSLGLAATLTGLGIAVVRGASWLKDRPAFERFAHYGPLVSAIVIATIGAIMVGQGFAQQGLSLSPLAATGLTALAIAGFAFSHPFGPRRATELA